MRKLDQGEKILSIVNSGLCIIVVLYTNFFKPELMNYAIIFAVAIIALTILFLAIKIISQSKKIHKQEEKIQNLENNQRHLKKEMADKEKKIAELQKLMNVPFFKKWRLIYSFIWRNSISFLTNSVNLFEIHVSRKLVGVGKYKDNIVSYIFSGVCIEDTPSFRFCLAGANDISLEKIKFHAEDLINNETLEYKAISNSMDSNIKFIDIYFREKMNGKSFKIKCNWQWPKTAYVKFDYFSIPNIYSITTKRIILDLYLTEDMNPSNVETYKFGLSDAEPQFLGHVYKNEEGYYRSIIEDPEKNADYITYYE